MSETTATIDVSVPRCRSSTAYRPVPPRFLAVVIRTHKDHSGNSVDTWLGIKFDEKGKAVGRIKKFPHRLFDFENGREEMLILDTFTFDKKIEFEVRHTDRGLVDWPQSVSDLKTQWDTYKEETRKELELTRQHVQSNLKLIGERIKLAKAQGPAGRKALKALRAAQLRNKKCLRTYPIRQRQRRDTWLKQNREKMRKQINSFFAKIDSK